MCSKPQIYGLICEFNPFHNGHRYLLRQIPSDSPVVAVMSGAFVQRGEPAVLDKHTRARCALMNGVDLVLELPSVWACSGAESFAAGGVAVLNALHCVDRLIYGSEHPDGALQRTVAAALDSPAFSARLTPELARGISFAAARENAVRALYGERAAELLRSPNDTLGIEYQKALLRTQSTIQPIPIARIGAAHDSTQSESDIASASLIRAQMQENRLNPALIPPELVPILTRALARQGGCPDMERLARTALAGLRLSDPSVLSDLPDLSEGLEHRLYAAAQRADSIASLCTECKSKRYSLARIRRIVAYFLLGRSVSDSALSIPYIRVLGLTDRGRKVLRIMQQNAALPIITRPAEIRSLGENARRVFELECAATELRALSLPTIPPTGSEYTEQIIYIT